MVRFLKCAVNTTRHAAATLRTIAHTLCGNYSCTVRIPTDKRTQIAPRNEDPAKSTGSRMAFLSRDLSAKQAMAILSRGQHRAQSETSLMNSAIWKLAEFAKLRYPVQALLRACSLVAVNTRNATWFKVRGTFSKYAYQYAPP
jgi:hypothetical protein